MALRVVYVLPVSARSWSGAARPAVEVLDAGTATARSRRGGRDSAVATVAGRRP